MTIVITPPEIYCVELYLVGLTGGICIHYVLASPTDEPRYIRFLLCILGALLGWLVLPIAFVWWLLEIEDEKKT